MKTHTEEEFKRLLKNLFMEKRRVKELKRRLEGNALHKNLRVKRSGGVSSEECARLGEEGAALDPQLVARKGSRGALAAMAQGVGEWEKEREELLEKMYREMRGISRKNATLLEETSALEHKVEELMQEVRRARSHLARKVKEATILRDVVERQKLQIEESYERERKQQIEIEKLVQSLHAQKVHEEKWESHSKDRLVAAEVAVRDWQDKYLELQTLLAEKTRQLAPISHTFPEDNAHTLTPDLGHQGDEVVLTQHCPHHPDDQFQASERRFASKKCEKNAG